MIKFELCDKNNIEDTANLFYRMAPAGWVRASAPCFKKNLLHALATDARGTLVVANDADVPIQIGYVAAIEYPVFFWGKIILDHPLSFLSATLPYILKKLRGIMLLQPKTYSENSPPRFQWSRNNERTARVLFIGVLEKYRGQAVGTRLYNALFKELAKKGCEILEAHIDAGNDASLKLHAQAGFSMTKCAMGEFLAHHRVNHRE